MEQATVLKQFSPPNWNGGAMSLVRIGPREYGIREMGWFQSLHSTYRAALADFNARIAKAVQQ